MWRRRVGKGAQHSAVWSREPRAPCPPAAVRRARFTLPTLLSNDGSNPRETMLYQNLIGTGVFAAVLATSTTAQAFDDAKYPDLSGQWVAVRMPGVTGQPALIRPSPGAADNKPR